MKKCTYFIIYKGKLTLFIYIVVEYTYHNTISPFEVLGSAVLIKYMHIV